MELEQVEIDGNMYTVEDIPAEVAQNALDVQCACNVSGVILSMARDLERLNKLPSMGGTGWRNNHPVLILYAVQIAHLTHGGTALMSTPDRYSKASDICRKAVEYHKLKASKIE